MPSFKFGLLAGLPTAAVGLSATLSASAQQTHPILSRINLPPGRGDSAGRVFPLPARGQCW